MERLVIVRLSYLSILLRSRGVRIRSMLESRYKLRCSLCLLVGPLVLFVNTLFAELPEATEAMDKLKSEVKFHTLSNGMRVIFYSRGDAPVFGGVIGVGVGGVDEPVGKTGIAHMLEHMAFKGDKEIGTKDYGRERKLLEELEEIAMASDAANDFNPEQQRRWKEIDQELNTIWEHEEFSRLYRLAGSVDLNAMTSADYTGYVVNLPTRAFEFWCKMESERLKPPVMRQFYSERDVVMEERRMRFDDSPTGRLYELMLNTAFSVHPYRSPLIGYPQDISHLLATETLEFHQKYYVPSNIVIGVVGALDPDKHLDMIEKYFGVIETGPYPPRPTQIEPEQVGPKTVTYYADAAPYISIAYHKPNTPDQDDATLTVMADILTQSALSRFYKRFVEEKKLASAIGSYQAPGDRYPNLLVFSAPLTVGTSPEKFLSEFEAAIEEFKLKGPSEAELSRVKRSLAMNMIISTEGNLSLARELVMWELSENSSWTSKFSWFDQAMAVSAEDIILAARKYLVPQSRTVAMLKQRGAN